MAARPSWKETNYADSSNASIAAALRAVMAGLQRNSPRPTFLAGKEHRRTYSDTSSLGDVDAVHAFPLDPDEDAYLSRQRSVRGTQLRPPMRSMSTGGRGGYVVCPRCSHRWYSSSGCSPYDSSGYTSLSDLNADLPVSRSTSSTPDSNDREALLTTAEVITKTMGRFVAA